jgi:hypothetical protein
MKSNYKALENFQLLLTGKCSNFQGPACYWWRGDQSQKEYKRMGSEKKPNGEEFKTVQNV